MTSWVMSLGWNWLLVPVGFWFLRGLWKAYSRPRIKLHLITKTEGGHFVDVTRQELVPPWRQLRETWFVTGHPEYTNGRDRMAIREGDGRTAPYVPGYFFLSSSLGAALCGALRVALAREAETEELSK